MIRFGYMNRGILKNSIFFSEPREYDFERVNRYKGYQYLTKESYDAQKALYEEFYNRAKAYMDNIDKNKIQNSDKKEYTDILNMLDGCLDYINVFSIAMAMNVRDRTIQYEEEKRKAKKKEFTIKKVYKGC